MDSCITPIYQLVFSVLISIFIIIPIFSILFGLNEILRIIVKIYFKLTGNSAVISKGNDGFYTVSTRAILRIMCVFQSNYNFDKLKELFIQRILEVKNPKGDFMHKKLRSTFSTEAGYSCWKYDVNFDPNNHFRTFPEYSTMTEEELMDFVQELGEPFPQDRPQWELMFIPKLSNPNESAILLRIHHSYGDGLSIINTLAEQLSPEERFPYVINPVTFKPPFWSTLFLKIKTCAYFSWTLLNEIWNMQKISEDRHHSESDSVICHNGRFNLSLNQLKTIQKKTNGCTISAILLTATQNAMDKINKKHLRLESYIVLAKLPYPKGKLCNRAKSMNFVMPDAKCDAHGGLDYWTQLEEVNKTTQISTNLTFFVNDAITQLIGRLPAALLQNMKRKNVLMISNLPFVKRPFNLGGGIMTDCFVFPTFPQSIMISSLSVEDKINVTIGAGANLLSKDEVAVFVDEMKNQLNAMQLYNNDQREHFDQYLV